MVKKRRQISFFLLSLFVVSAVAIVGWFNFVNHKVSAAWFDDRWSYRKAITLTISSSASDITNLDTLLVVDTTGITSKVQSSCQDLRFINQAGVKLKYFIDTCTNNSATNKIWVQVDLVPKNTTTYTLYMYYGNVGALSESDSVAFTLYNGLTNYWTMNESSWTNNCSTASIIDSSVNANSAKSCPNSTGPTGGITGKFGNAGTFDGTNDYLDGGNGSSVNLGTGDFTINAWVKRAVAETQSSDGDAVIGKGDWAFGKGWAFYSARDAGLVEFQAWDTSNKSQYFSSYTGTINDGTWHMLTLVETRATGGDFYLDGVYQESRGTTFTGDINSATSLNIGHSRNAVDYNHGGIDEVRMYNRVLSQSEITKLFSNPGVITTTATATSKPTTSFATEEVSQGPVGFWRFDEGQGTTAKDSSQNGNFATLSGASLPTWQTEDQCVSVKCLYFGGATSYVDLGTKAALNTTTGNFTLAAWIRTTQTTEGHIISRGGGGGVNAAVFRIGNTVGKVNCRISDSAAVDSRQTVNDGQWHYVVCSVDRSGLSSVYIDGRLDYSVDISAKSANSISDSNWAIGVENLAGKSHYFNGFIDEPKIYNYARSASQVKTDYLNSGISHGDGTSLGSDPRNAYKALNQGLVGYWKLNESSGTRSDSSGNGYTLSDWNTVTSNPGKFDKAGQFTRANSESLYIADNANLSVTGDYTVSGWFYQDTNTSGDRCMICKADVFGSKREFLLLRATSGPLQFYISNDGTNTASVTSSEFSNTASAWNFVVAWYDSTNKTINLQVNGGKVDTTAYSLTPYDSDSQFMIGGGGNTLTTALSFFDGRIDDVRVYKRVLSPADRQLLYSFAPGPDAYWQMEESGGSRVDTIGGLSLSVGAGNVYSKPGKFGKAAYFPNASGDYLSKTDDATLSMGDMDFTVEAWMYMDNKGDYRTIISKGTANTTAGIEYILNYDVVNDRFSWQISNGTTTTTLRDASLGSPVAGRWYHLAGWYDSFNNLTGLTINGVNTTTASNTTGSQDTAGSFYVGANIGPASHHGGGIDEVRIYRYRRTIKQIVEDMNAGHPAGGSPVGSQVAYWKFNEGQGTTLNDSVGTSSGTLNGMASPASIGISGWQPEGKFGKSLGFDGSTSYVSIGNSGTLHFPYGFTFSSWVRTTSSASQIIFSRYTNDGTGVAFYFGVGNVTAGKVNINVDSDGSCASAGTINRTSLTSVNDGKWHYVATVFDPGKRLDVYVDGHLDNDALSGTIPSASALCSAIAEIGSGNKTGGGVRTAYFNGLMDELKVFNYPLTDSEMRIDYNQGQAISFGSLGASTFDGKTASNSASSAYCVPGDTSSCSSPVGEWNFEEGFGTTANDTAGNANTGTLQNAPIWIPGKVGKALSFNGSNQDVTIADATSLKPSSAITYQAWVYPTVVQTSSIIEKGNSNTAGYGLVLVSSGGGLLACEIVPGATSGTYSGASSERIPLNKWTHIAVTYDDSLAAGAKANIFVNGVSSVRKNDAGCGLVSTGVGGIKSDTSAVKIASRQSSTLYFGGYVDQVKVYGYARTAAQVAYDYNRSLPTSWWKMDECQGTIVHDSIGTQSAAMTIGTGAGTGHQDSAGTCGSSASTVWYNGRTGKYNSSINLDGIDDYVPVESRSYPLTIPTASDWSIGAWIYPTSLPNTFNEIYAEGNSANTVQAFRFYVGSAGDVGISFLSDQDVGYGGTGPRTISVNNWYHVFVSKSGSVFNVCVNGICKATTSTPAGTFTFDRSSIGAITRSSGTSEYFTGQIDDLKVWNYGLTTYQIRNEYNQSAAVRFGPLTGSP
jgi:hypothetical protein